MIIVKVNDELVKKMKVEDGHLKLCISRPFTEDEKQVEEIMRRILAYLDWLHENHPIYHNIKKLITENKEKRKELVALLSEEIP